MKALSQFFPRLLPYLPGCSEPMAAQALLDAAIAFCEDSLVLREQLDPVTLTAGESTVSVEAPAQQQIARVMEVYIDGQPARPVLYEDQDRLSRYGVPSQPALPRSFYTTRVNSEFVLNLLPAPDKAYECRVEVALRPVRTAKQVADDLFDLWIEPVVLGAMSRLLAIPDQPFSDATRALAMSMAAAQASRNARVEGSYGRVKGSMSIKPRPFVRGYPWP